MSGQSPRIVLKPLLTGLGDPPDSIGASSPKIWSTSRFGANRGRRLVCLLPSSSLSEILVLGESSQIVLKLSTSARVNSLTRLEKVLPELDQIHKQVQVGEDASTARFRLPASPKYRSRGEITRPSWNSFQL